MCLPTLCGICLPTDVCLLLCGWQFLFFELFPLMLLLLAAPYYFFQKHFRKEGDTPIVRFVHRTGRLPLTVYQAFNYYGYSIALFVLFLAFVSSYLIDMFIEKWMVKEPDDFFYVEISMVILSLLLGYIQYRRLYFRKLKTTLTKAELYDVMCRVAEEEEWRIEHSTKDYFVGYSNVISLRSILSCKGEQIYVVYGNGVVWINCLCSVGNRGVALTSAGRNAKHYRTVLLAINQKEQEKKKDKHEISIREQMIDK